MCLINSLLDNSYFPKIAISVSLKSSFHCLSPKLLLALMRDKKNGAQSSVAAIHREWIVEETREKEERAKSGPASLARFMSAFYALLNYLVNGTRGARGFCTCMIFPRAPLAPLLPTGSLWTVSREWRRSKKARREKERRKKRTGRKRDHRLLINRVSNENHGNRD